VEAKVVRVLGTVVAGVVFTLALLNARRGEWGMAFAGMVLVVGIASVMAGLQPPERR